MRSPRFQATTARARKQYDYDEKSDDSNDAKSGSTTVIPMRSPMIPNDEKALMESSDSE
jgi:hypothetical protein